MSDRQVRLLIVEDDDEMRTLLRKALTRENYEVRTAQHGVEAIGMLEKGEEFDVLVTDIRMPQMDGMELLRRVRKLRPGLRVIIITAYAELDNYLEVMREGAFDYLTKPFKIPDLLGVVERAVERETPETPKA